MIFRRGLYFNQDGGAAGGGGTPPPAGGAAGAAGGATPPPAAGGGAAGGNGGTPPAAADWRAGLPDETKGYVELKGWKDPASLVDSYKNLEKFHGVPPDQLLKLPKDAADKAAMDAIYDRLGRPKTAAEYRIEAPKEGGNPQLAEWAKGTFHELGLTAKQGETLFAKWNELNATSAEAANDQAAAAEIRAAEGLKREWGAAHDQHIETAKRGAQKFGVDGATMDKIQKSLGFAETMKFFQKIGEGTGEGRFVEGKGGSPQPQILSPGAAMAKIKELQSDKIWSERYLKGDKDAKAEMAQLHNWALG